ncbi:MAG: glycosyl hydrolase, partial [Candidatus Hydrogenedentes bacterium]|nr:glycosyl hydrolase [Candidatus Hydrogenedentota bacterium]
MNNPSPGVWMCCVAAVASFSSTAQVPDSVKLVSAFDAKAFMSPDSLFWPGPFWLWNAPLEPDHLRAQLRDMAAHGFHSVCMLPMPHAFRPDSTNNGLDPDYLTPEFMERTRLAVEEASALGMNWWLYDEGGWPSGQALGKVTQDHPEFGQHTLVREKVDSSGPYAVPSDALVLVVEETKRVVRPGETWSPQSNETAYVYRVKRGGYADLLNPDATRRFLELTHEAYRGVLAPYFGKTVHFAFTDEPNVPNLNLPKSITWTPNMDALYRDKFGRDIAPSLPLLFTTPGEQAPPEVARARIDFYDLWTVRFRDAYFLPIRDWCRQAGLASGGHLNGEDETLNAVRYGFGHALRQLRAMDVPGVDLIWRQLFPGREKQHFFAKYASSAAHQNGTRFAFSESFCVYGNGLTPAQAKWLIDYQYLRGINLLVVGCMPLTTQDHHMTGERPHFGSVDPLWESEEGLWAYTARMGYLLSLGTPGIRAALYYPVRDMWALGLQAAEAASTHDELAQEMLAGQRDFDLIDDDLLMEPATHIDGKQLVAGAMRYDTIVCGKVRWMHPDSLARLHAFAAAGGQVVCFGHTPGSDGAPGDGKTAFPS